MFSSSSLINWVMSLAFLFTMGCSGGLGGCGCGEEQLPSWDYIPVDQQVEGGGQVRVTPNGFNKLTALIPAVINDTLGAGICIPRNQVVDAGIAEATICGANDGMCTPGCQVDINIDSINMSVPANDRLNVRAQFDVHSDIHIDYEVFWVISGSCTATASLQNAVFDVDLTVGIDPTDGELTLGVGNINNLDFTGISLSGCGGIADIVGAALSLFAELLNSSLGNLIINLIRPLIEDLVQGFLPDPLGLNHKVDLGALVSGLSPGTNATIELRGVPGGYAALKGGGMSLGLITGFNADEDETTRSRDLDSEAALCVPPLPAVDFAAAPHNLPIHPTRGTFALKAASEFDGAPDPAADLAIGLSETTLDLVGHHAVTSGVMCLGVGTSLVEQLNLGLIGILVPSLAELGSEDGSDPLLLTLRPQTALDFTIGEGTEADPNLTIGIRDLEVDFYAFLYGRYVRGFTISLTMNVGINLEFTTDANGAPAIMPTLTGLSTDMIDLTVLNSEFLREDAATLEQVLPTIFDLALPLITNGLGAFTLPDFAGFSLTNMSVNKVTTTEDDFLAIFANLGQVVSPRLIGLAEHYPSLGAKLAEMGPANDSPAFRVQTRAALANVRTPAPAAIRAALAGSPDGEMTAITIDVPAHDELGRELEHTWSIRQGIRHPFQKGDQLELRDPAFAMQGRYQINVQSRVVGDFRTHDIDGVDVDLVIDSVGPRIYTERARIDAGRLIVPASDLVSATETLRFQFGRPGDDTRWTDWVESISIDDAVAMADEAKQLRVWAVDELGNESETTLDLGPVINFHGTADSSGCSCAAGSTDTRTGAGLVLLALLTLALLVRPRRALARVRNSRAARSMISALPFVFAATLALVVSACSCGGDPGGDLTCEIDEDCIALCPENTIPICFDNQCVCADDVPYGRIGQHSDMAVSSNGSAWVSGYNSSHGDLMAARWPSEGPIPNEEWSFIDGVPDGPVVLPQSDVRGGIFDPGADVGQYTSVAVKPDDSVDIAYFDVDTGSLKFASNASGSWITHTVEAGAGQGDPELGFTVIGKYTSITVRSDDGRPGIAYLAEIGDGAGNITTEVRYAAAQSATPATSTDWNVWVVDTVTVPAPTAEMPDVLNLPMGVGLFIDSARLSDQSPVIAYYDRINGDLKLARFDPVAGTFQVPTIVDDGGRDNSNTDVGWYPSIGVDMNDDLHITYVSSTSDDLYYINTVDNLPAIVDDGYRIVGQNNDGLPKPEFHFVGDDSSVVMTNVGPVIVYQDATSHELLMANVNNIGEWERETIAGNEDPFEGGYGFYAAAALDGDQVVMSSWVVNQPLNAVWVEIFRRLVVVE